MAEEGEFERPLVCEQETGHWGGVSQAPSYPSRLRWYCAMFFLCREISFMSSIKMAKVIRIMLMSRMFFFPHEEPPSLLFQPATLHRHHSHHCLPARPATSLPSGVLWTLAKHSAGDLSDLIWTRWVVVLFLLWSYSELLLTKKLPISSTAFTG